MELNMNFRCYFPNGNKNDHRRTLKVEEIPRWIDSYKFTHPDCCSITVKLWFENEKEQRTK